MGEVETQLPEQVVASDTSDEIARNSPPKVQAAPGTVPGGDGNLVLDEAMELNVEAVKCALEAIASTGMFRHDWSTLKNMLSFQLKQVLLEYPEAKINTGDQNVSLDETYAEVETRLHQALERFDDGPPFTLQRLCEILLSAKTIYPNFSKLALALEKNLLVTSTLAASNEPSPPTPHNQENLDATHEGQKIQGANSVENGVDPVVPDRDEVMAEMEENAAEEGMAIDMEAFEDIVAPSEGKPTSADNS